MLDGTGDYFLYVPKTAGPGARILVTVHGISRNAGEHARSFMAHADRYGVVIVAPHFSASQFPGYQRLREKGKPSADVALDRIVAEVGRRTGARTDKLYLFGFSGGGQFVHRYAMAHPERVAAAVLGAPGWYTFPDADTEYPLGIKAAGKESGIEFSPQRLLQVPVMVVVGEKDIERDAALRTSKDVDEAQGPNRLIRGQRWVQAMASAAASNGLSTRYEFQILPKCGHDFSTCMKRGRMADVTFNFLLEEGRE